MIDIRVSNLDSKVEMTFNSSNCENWLESYGKVYSLLIGQVVTNSLI